MSVTLLCGSYFLYHQNSVLLHVLYYLCDWGITGTADFSKCLPQYLVGICLFAITNLFLFFMYVYYQSKRAFNRWHLVILRFLLYPLLATLLPLYGSFIGRSFYEVMNVSSTPMSISLFIVSIPIYIVSIFEFLFVNQFSTDTPVIDWSLLGAWDDSIMFLTVLSISLGTMISTALAVFPKWLSFVALVGYIVIVSYRIYLLYFVPMLRFLMNPIFMSICFMCICNCLFSVVHLITEAIPDFIYFCTSILFFIFFMIFFVRWYEMKKIRYLGALSYSSISNNEKPDDSEKRAHFDTLIFSSANDAISYMHIGVTFQAETILDFSFLRYLMENYAEPTIIFAVAKVASFFPAELQFLSYSLSIISKISETTMAQDFLIYQMRRIHVVRQSSVSADASSQLGVLQKMSRDTISQIRGFWGEILNAKADISFASLHYLRKVTLKTDSAFLDACDRFPNNVSIMNEYCRFQIEAMGNFSGAIISGKKMLLLDQGKNLTIDHAFRSLVNVYPNYLLNNIFNIHGNFVQKGLLYEASSGSISSLNSTQAEFEEKYEEIISQLYSHGKLRVALQTRMRSTKLSSLTLAQILSIIQLLSFIVLYLIIIFVLPISSEFATKIIAGCNEISKVTLTMQYISLVASVQSSISQRAFGGSTILRGQLGLSIDDMNDEPSILTRPYNAVFNASQIMRSQLTNALKSIMETLHSSIEDITVFSSASTLFIGDRNRTQELTLRSSLSMMLYLSDLYATYLSLSLSSDLTLNTATKLILNANAITSSMQLFQIGANENGDKYISNQKNMISTITIIIISAGFILFISIRIYNIIMIFKQAKQCSDLLRKTNPALIKESYKPIALKGQRESIRGNNVHSAHEVNVMMVIYPIVIVLSILLFAALAITSSVFFSNGLNIAESVFNWLSYANIRFSSIMGSFIIFCARSLRLIDNNASYRIIDSHISSLLLSHMNIDVTLMGIDQRFNDYYFSKKCEANRTTENYADYLNCLSLNNKINVAIASIQNLIEENSTSLNNQDFCSILYLIDMFLYNDFNSFQDMLVNYSISHFESSSSRTNSMCISGLIICCLVFLLEQFFIRTFQQSVEAIKQLISMLPPVEVATSTFLMDFINNGNKNEDKEVSLSASESILAATSNAAVMLDMQYIIQAVNKAVNGTTGFTPDQILGQRISWLIPEPSYDIGPNIETNDKFYKTLNRMRDSFNNEESNIYDSNSYSNHTTNEDINVGNLTTTTSNFNETENSDDCISSIMTIKCMTENGMLIPVRVIILFLPDKLNGNTQFALILRDLSKETEMLKNIQKARSRTNKLLRALIPKDVIGHEQAFSTDNGTVIMIEVSGLTEYVHTLSPQQLMENLKTVYNGFEKIAADFPAVSILKMNAEQFVACCGLFSYYDDIKEQAIQAVNFSSRMIEEIETINEELDIDLHLRIAINSGGPMIGSMLSPTMPTFEIFSPCIALAQKMQIEGEIGVIQVGETVAQQLQSPEYEVMKGIPIIGPAGSMEQVYAVRVLSHNNY